jgi:hypothetical protein
MIQKVVRKAQLSEFSEIKENLDYWLSRPPSERIEAVELLRRQHHGSAIRFQRVYRLIQIVDGKGKVIKSFGYDDNSSRL